MSAPGTYGMENAVGSVTFRRKLDHGHVVTIVPGTGSHVTYRMSNGVEATLPRSTFDADFEPVVKAAPPLPKAMADGLATFTAYFVRNYPGPDTIICDPNWHAPKIYSAARRACRLEFSEALLAIGAVYHEDEDRWYHDSHRSQWLSEHPATYLGWIKGYDSASKNFHGANLVIREIEKRFPNWESYRDLIDCIDCTMHSLQKSAEGGAP